MRLPSAAFEAAASAIPPLRQYLMLTGVILYSKIAKVNRFNLNQYGAVAQLGEHLHGMQGVESSNLSGSTKNLRQANFWWH